MSARNNWNEVLRYLPGRPRGNIQAKYREYRAESGLRERCDNPSCPLHTSPAIWDGKPIRMIVDHVDGCRFNNRPKNLRLLCPNCNSQLGTTGGRNKGRVVGVTEGGYAIDDQKDGRLDHRLIAEGGHFTLTGQDVTLAAKKG